MYIYTYIYTYIRIWNVIRLYFHQFILYQNKNILHCSSSTQLTVAGDELLQ